MDSDETAGYDLTGALCLATGIALVGMSTLSYRMTNSSGIEGTTVDNFTTYMGLGPLLEPMFLFVFLLGAVTAVMDLAILIKQAVSVAVGV